MSKETGYKKGVEYSHYCGTELQDIMSSIKLSSKIEDKEEAKQWQEHAIKRLEDLRNKIADLDKLNKMTY